MKQCLFCVTLYLVSLFGCLLFADEVGKEVKPEEVEGEGKAAVEEVEEEQRVYGWKEWILFEGKKKPMRAKFDSGAKTSSIHGENIKEFEKDGEKWVRFTLFDPNRKPEKAELIQYECPVTRVARIRNADGQKSERLVVELDFWIGGEKRRAEFSLNYRGDMINPVLLGRSVVQTLGLIDTGRTYLMDGSPKKAPVKKKPVAEVTEEEGENSVPVEEYSSEEKEQSPVKEDS